MTNIPQGLTIFAGGQASLDAMTDVADSATTHLSGDIFTFHPGTVQSAVVRAVSERHVQGTFLVDPEHGRDAGSAFRAGGVAPTLGMHGAVPHKNHGKSFVADGQRAVLTTGAIVPATAGRSELTARFEGPAAGALDRLTRETARSASGLARVRAAADAAHAFGITSNDPRHEVTHLRDDVFGMVDAAKHALLIGTKRYESPELQAKVEAARARGVQVKVVNPPGLHANFVVQDADAAYFGTAHMSKRSLTSTGSGGRLSRELGLVVRHPAGVAQVRRALEQLEILRPEAIGAAGPPRFDLADGVVNLVEQRRGGGRVALAVAGAAALVGGGVWFATRD